MPICIIICTNRFITIFYFTIIFFHIKISLRMLMRLLFLAKKYSFLGHIHEYASYQVLVEMNNNSNKKNKTLKNE